jgi:hypothetical protein
VVAGHKLTPRDFIPASMRKGLPGVPLCKNRLALISEFSVVKKQECSPQPTKRLTTSLRTTCIRCGHATFCSVPVRALEVGYWVFVMGHVYAIYDVHLFRNSIFEFACCHPRQLLTTAKPFPYQISRHASQPGFFSFFGVPANSTARTSSLLPSRILNINPSLPVEAHKVSNSAAAVT